ncbi:uncharacterized protein BYT42DRAFT_579827 [Radiomyces spectabilis]|uniref:uncharacterized protein n=1 Tax=Radiomyces spectabilis TaxID=64574 RepID=UPI00221FBC60|nr:uncharacterized protein BYT42DRAFT_579827 [Radiomyces spectabilis]KAI8371323.1 hypothetical protein BYT42DRAFT_579827 [Radiomyces spectabilis]
MEQTNNSRRKLDLPTLVPENMPYLGVVKSWLHVSQIIVTVLTIAVIAPVIAIERRFYDASQGAPNYTIFVCIFSFFIPIFLLFFPWMYDRKSKCKRTGKFFLKPRTNLILTGICSLLWALSGIGMTVHATDNSNCVHDGSLEQDDGSYSGAWNAQCGCSKAAAVFCWTGCLAWLATLICSVIISWNERQLARQSLKQYNENKQDVICLEEEKALDEAAEPQVPFASSLDQRNPWPLPSTQDFTSSTIPVPSTMHHPHMHHHPNGVTYEAAYNYPSSQATTNFPQYTSVPMVARYQSPAPNIHYEQHHM